MATNLALKVAIVQSGKPQIVIASEAGIHESRLSKIVRGHLLANDDEQKALAKALRRARHELFAEKVA
jgi:inorganic triphosphatase YgiF